MNMQRANEFYINSWRGKQTATKRWVKLMDTNLTSALHVDQPAASHADRPTQGDYCGEDPPAGGPHRYDYYVIRRARGK